MSIQVLSSDLVNQIAAGEVVERPAHLVKELVENSIDANADEIHVEISEGGRNVRVSDNGDGILSQDLAKALQRYATSKIRITDDLWNLNTFGFRGEALASIAAVSQLTLQSIHKDEKKPSQIQADFGKLSDTKPSSRTRGTEIKIENLFQNIPARLKFLKSESSEAQQIKQMLKALALAHPRVEIKLVQEGTLQFFYQKKSNLLERAKDVLEKSDLFYSKSQKGSIETEAVFSSPHDVARTSKQIWIFAQDRYIQDRSLQAAVMDAYRSLLMHGEYPYAVIKLKCPPSEIDVNIHPAKSQVKFQDASLAFRAAHGVLRQALEQAPWIKSPSAAAKTQTPADYSASVPAPQFFQDQAFQNNYNLAFSDQSLSQTQFKQKDFEFQKPMQPVSTKAEASGYWSSLQILGQANLTYIICQKSDRLVFVDQHAAHERVVFESLMESWRLKKFDVQEYLFPFVVDLSEDKVEALLKIQDQIQDMGIQLERMGPQSLGIKSAPSLIKESAIPSIFEKMAQDLIEYGGSYSLEKKIGDIFATMACHSVVRAGQSLSVPEMGELLKSMDRFALSSFCPHGRPVSVETSFTDLEKQFGRIN